MQLFSQWAGTAPMFRSRADSQSSSSVVEVRKQPPPCFDLHKILGQQTFSRQSRARGKIAL
jgi:hypothetical protein